MVTTTIGTMTLTVDHDGQVPDDENQPPSRFGPMYRQQYTYMVREDGVGEYISNDLHSGVGADPDERDALQTLVSFLAAAGEAYVSAMRDRWREEPEDDFPWWVRQAAYMNSDELDMYALENAAH